jgi:hypothetical protein
LAPNSGACRARWSTNCCRPCCAPAPSCPAALDNLHRAERLGLLQHADEWAAMRLVRNRLVHEYFERPDAMLPALKRARDFVDTLCTAHHAIRSYAQARFAV